MLLRPESLHRPAGLLGRAVILSLRRSYRKPTKKPKKAPKDLCFRHQRFRFVNHKYRHVSLDQQLLIHSSTILVRAAASSRACFQTLQCISPPLSGAAPPRMLLAALRNRNSNAA